jgi:WD40 repeat protein
MRPLYRTLLASADEDSSLITLTGHVYSVSCLAFVQIPDANPLLAGGAGGTVRLWDPVNGGLVGKPLVSSLTTVESIAFSSDTRRGLMLAAGGGNGTVAVWKGVPHQSALEEFNVFHNPVNSVVFVVGPSRSLWLVAATADGKIAVWSPITGQFLDNYRSPIRSVVLGRDLNGRPIAAGAALARSWGPLTIFDPLSRATLFEFPTKSRNYSPLAFHIGSDQRLLLVSRDRDGLTTLVSDAKTGATIISAHTPPDTESAALGIDQDQHFLIATASGSLGVNPSSVFLLDTFSHRREFLTGHTQPVRTVAFGTTLDGKLMLASGGEDHAVRVWDPTVRSDVRTSTGQTEWIQPTDSKSSLDGCLMEAADSDGKLIRVWKRDPRADRATDPLKWGYDDTVGFTVSPDGILLAAGSDNRKAWVWEPASGATIVGPLTGDGKIGRAVAFGADRGGRLLLAVGGMSGMVRVYDPLSGETLNELDTHLSQSVSALAFTTSSDNQLMLAVGSCDPDLMDALAAPIQVCDPLTGELVGEQLRGHTQHVLGIAFGQEPGGRLLLASGSTDRTVRLWDPLTSETLGPPLTGHTGWAGPVVFSTHPESHHLLLVSGGNEAILLWNPISRERKLELRRRSPVRSISAAGRTLGITDHEGVSIIELDDQFDW